MLRLFYSVITHGGTMLYLSFALYREASNFIKELKLKSEKNAQGYQVFSADGIKLIVTGTGNISPSISLTDFFTGEKISPSDFFFNVGSSASYSEENYGKIFICNKIFEASTARCFYPDMLFSNIISNIFSDICSETFSGNCRNTVSYAENISDFRAGEAVCITLPVPAENTSQMKSYSNSLLCDSESEADVIFDMEASSCYQTAVRYFKTGRMVFLKYVTDSGLKAKKAGEKINIGPSDITAERLLRCFRFFAGLSASGGEAPGTTYESCGLNLKAFSVNGKSKEELLRNASESAGALAPLLSCSVTMRYELEKLLLYCECSGKSSLDTVNSFIQTHSAQLPAPKKAGIQLLRTFKEKLIGNGIISDSLPAHEKILNAPAAMPLSKSVNHFFKTGFSHIYVEKQAACYTLTKKILKRFSGSQIIYIDSYKEIFNRSNQDFALQKSSPALILAVNNGERIYPASRTCQNFGHEHFYYTSQIKNCIYDCEYCYLQGMYPSGNICIFVNIEDSFRDVERLLDKHPVSLSISYDTDLTALEQITGFVHDWCGFALKKDDLTVEIRTKCASVRLFDELEPSPDIIFAYTLSPKSVIQAFEHGTSGYEQRKTAIYAAIEKGFSVRLCIDPILPVENYKKQYRDMITDFFSNPAALKITDVSIGGFRISREYIKQMQEARLSRITAFPYEIIDGICCFPKKLQEEMLSDIKGELLKHIETDKLFIAAQYE